MSARETIVPVFVPHLGCPNDCVFCNQKRITSHTEPATPQTVYDAVEGAASVLEGKTERQLAFYGGSFTAIPARDQEALLGAAEGLIKAGRLDSIRLSTRPDAIDPEVIARLRRFSVKTVELGAQSMDERVLLLAGRGHTAQSVIDASGLLKAAGFRLIIQMMTGLPGDTDETCISTAKKIVALKPDGVRIYPTVIIRDTALCDLWQRGLYPEHKVEDAVRVCSEIVPLFREAGIPIIRLGLNPTDELSSGGALGGAYHPALGELVKSRILLNTMLARLEGTPKGRKIIITCPPSLVSQVSGQRRCNIEAVRTAFSPESVKINPVPDAEDVQLTVI